MRYYDISGRVAVYTVLPPTAVTANGNRTYHNGTGATAATTPIDRTGFYSYILHVQVQSQLDAQSETVAMSALMESCATSTNGATWTSGMSAFTSLLVDGTGAQDAYYKQLYLNQCGTSSSANNYIAPGFHDQCTDTDDATYGFVCTAGGDLSSLPFVIDARIFGTFRNDKVVGKYVAPNICVQDSEDSGTVTWVAAELILGGGDQMPVMEAGTAGTSSYYSKGQ